MWPMQYNNCIGLFFLFLFPDNTVLTQSNSFAVERTEPDYGH